ncbi:site-specific integrase [Castellaniella sp.]|uniref:site-specific integrase n=1 Tax=Castellaniella sp. TaxID=1955812 RepID=UPI002AFFED76|nr:site-specific integrase [Castellaniella sp.]
MSFYVAQAPTVEIKKTSMARGLIRYRKTVSILKKGYEQERYRILQILRSFLAAKHVHEVTSVDIASYRDMRLGSLNRKTGKPLSPATVRLEMSLLSNFFDLARIEWGYTRGANPCADVRKPKNPPGRDRRLTNREERQILRYAHGHQNLELYSIIMIALTTAMRQSEILGMRWEHINFKTRVAHLPDTKNGSKRDVPLSSKAREAIMRMGLKPHGPIFSYTKNGIKSTWRFMMLRLGIEDLHFHDMRHEAISRFFELGTLDMMEIAAISGHKSLAMLKRYTHLRANRLVHKLEGTKKKAQMAVLNHLVPYPGILVAKPAGAHAVVFPDFGAEQIIMTREAENKKDAVAAAQDLLLRTLLGIIREGGKLPAPDNYLECQHAGDVVMIDPMAMA